MFELSYVAESITVFSCSLEMKGHNRCVSRKETYLVRLFGYIMTLSGAEKR